MTIRRITLSPRLAATASLVVGGGNIVDVGTDHAYLPAHLILTKKIPFAIASDLRKSPLDNARDTVIKYKLQNKIELRLSDGLSTIRKIYNPRIYAADSQAAGEDTMVLKGDGIFKIADFTIGYLSVPGHSTDSMCYKIGNVIFTGDTLSAGKIGSTNNSYAEKTLVANVQTKIFSQPECTTLLPGHGPPTSIEAEKFFNLTLGCPELEK